MKELSIEEKAKRYDEAIERTREFVSKDNVEVAEYIFPELSDSEDERIRKTLIKGFNKLDKSAVWYKGITNSQILAWLEKQGEQRFVDLALYNDLKPWEKPQYIINAINRKRVEPFLKGDALHKFKNEFHTLKQILHLLYDYDTPVHYRLALHWASWGAQNLQGYFGMSKEEREKMDDVTGEQKPADNEMIEILRAEYEKGRADAIVEMQKSWSEEDENNILFLTSIIEEYFKDKEKITLYGDTVCANFTKEDVIDRLKSLRPQKHWKPSSQQICSVDYVIKEYESTNISLYKEAVKQLISLREQLKALLL